VEWIHFMRDRVPGVTLTSVTYIHGYTLYPPLSKQLVAVCYSFLHFVCSPSVSIRKLTCPVSVINSRFTQLCNFIKTSPFSFEMSFHYCIQPIYVYSSQGHYRRQSYGNATWTGMKDNKAQTNINLSFRFNCGKNMT